MHVRLAGHACPWRFRGSEGLEEWILESPWTREGGVRAFRVGSGDAAGALASFVWQAVRAADDGLSGVRLEEAEPGVGSVRAALANALRIAGPVDGLGFVRSAAKGLTGRPVMLLVRHDEEGAARAAVAEAAALSELLHKLQPAARLTVGVLGAGAGGPEALDFRIGQPEGPLLASRRRTMEPLWRAYVHRRLAWEAGGDLGLATRVEERFGALPVGADDELEAALNDAAREWCAGVDGGARSALIRWLEARGRSVPPGEGELAAGGLLWAPPGSLLRRPVPWVARGLMLEGERRGSAILRQALVCGLLAQELLVRCLDLEAVVRNACFRQTGGAEAPADFVARLRDFEHKRGAEAQQQAALYPGGSPAVPRDGWAFMSLGELLGAVRLGAGHEQAHQLRRLRNAIAHGHFVGWSAVQRIVQLERAVG